MCRMFVNHLLRFQILNHYTDIRFSIVKMHSAPDSFLYTGALCTKQMALNGVYLLSKSAFVYNLLIYQRRVCGIL